MFVRKGMFSVAAIGMLLLTGCGGEEPVAETGESSDRVVAETGGGEQPTAEVNDDQEEISASNPVQGGASNGIGVELPADPISRGDYNQSVIDEAEEGKTVHSHALCMFGSIGYSPFYPGQSQEKVGVSMAPNVRPEFYVPISDLVATGEEGVYILDEPEPMQCDMYAVAITTVMSSNGRIIDDMTVIYQHATDPDIQVHERVYPGYPEASVPLADQPVVDLNG
ncbi:hypothetical protein FJZ39_00940 [Candidatus Saccharibacteria bacterium]|nr:hypothetical protein [Candidatus Saccharibacteria bacterium]